MLDVRRLRALSQLAEDLHAEVRERGVRYGSTGPGAFVVDAVPRLFTREEWDRYVGDLLPYRATCAQYPVG